MQNKKMVIHFVILLYILKLRNEMNKKMSMSKDITGSKKVRCLIISGMGQSLTKTSPSLLKPSWPKI